MLAQAKMPLNFWYDFVATSAFAINVLSTPILNGLSPYQKLFLRKPYYKFLKVFGYSVNPHQIPYDQHKLQFRSFKYFHWL